MTKDNLIFLGACAILAPHTKGTTTLEMHELIRRSLVWSKLMYEKQHKLPEVVTPACAGAPIQPEGYGWQAQISYDKGTTWRTSQNFGLKGLLFPTKGKCEEAIATWKSGTTYPYRAYYCIPTDIAPTSY